MTSRKWQLAAGLTGLALFASIGVGVVGLPVAVCLSAHRHAGRVAHRRC